MCLIIDTNIAARVFRNPEDPDFGYIHTCILTGRPCNARFVYGGELAREYSRSPNILSIILELDRAGRARRISDELVDNETQVVVDSQLCRSDDPHIIALARVSNVRLLCSHDQALHQDFKNSALIDDPRGKVYQTTAHKRLVRQFCR